MKKTIAASLLVLASGNAMALRPPQDPNEYRTACLKVHQHSDGSLISGCDDSRNNDRANKPLLKNGCAVDQIALHVNVKERSIEACLPPGVAQL